MLQVILRTDASTLIGTGHVMRCLTLAEALSGAGHVCRFICRDLPGNLVDRIVGGGFDCTRLSTPEGDVPDGPPVHAAWAGVTWQQDAEETRTAIGPTPPDWLVLDHYAFDARWERAVVPKGTKLLVIDDLADRPHIADLLLDQNLGRDAADYDGLVPPQATLLIGPRYALLRPEFAEKRAEALADRAERADHGIRNLLISMGGVDLPDATSSILAALHDCPLPADTRITVVMGSGAPALDRVRSLAAAMPWPTEVLVDVRDMAALMAEADLAIGAAGSTSWERCCVGLPTLAVAIAENQESTVAPLTQWGAAIALEPLDSSEFTICLSEALSELASSEKLASMIKHAAPVCDGDGITRLLGAMTPPTLTFRPARVADSRRVWEWRHEGNAHRFNRNAAQPAFPVHHAWFCNAVVESSRKLHILENGTEPVGYIRLDRDQAETGRISICLTEHVRGHGLGAACLRHADEMAREWGLTTLFAEIHPGNIASIKAFEMAGYQPCGRADGFLIHKRQLRAFA